MQMEARSEELGQRGSSCFGYSNSLGRARMRGRGGDGADGIGLGEKDAGRRRDDVAMRQWRQRSELGPHALPSRLGTAPICRGGPSARPWIPPPVTESSPCPAGFVSLTRGRRRCAGERRGERRIEGDEPRGCRRQSP